MAKSTKKIAGDEAVHYIPPRKRRKRGSGKMQPPLTPMIDVTFLLLLFFLLTLTFREAEGLIPGTLPGDMTGEPQPDAPSVYIKISPAPGNPVLAVFEMKGENRQIRQAEELFQKLQGRRRVAGGAELPVVIEPRKDVLWEHVVNCFNQAVRAGFKKIGFATTT